MTHLAGDGVQQQKSLRLGTFAPLRWINCLFQANLASVSAHY
jgi:hypothetical protein